MGEHIEVILKVTTLFFTSLLEGIFLKRWRIYNMIYYIDSNGNVLLNRELPWSTP